MADLTAGGMADWTDHQRAVCLAASTAALLVRLMAARTVELWDARWAERKADAMAELLVAETAALWAVRTAERRAEWMAVRSAETMVDS